MDSSSSLALVMVTSSCSFPSAPTKSLGTKRILLPGSCPLSQTALVSARAFSFTKPTPSTATTSYTNFLSDEMESNRAPDAEGLAAEDKKRVIEFVLQENIPLVGSQGDMDLRVREEEL
ncbi:AT-rich interactive domain-containing protein 3A [Striga asiatica]|uniref:AT-rich interactive domain-containing protein 3A n=1 Tax=Striga asiatica TaxID=4170 RepID=A0A5A7PDN1_STRAF|nr:AT-rich interactive domain-containing protein 3A [Striga asiatica]